MADQESDLSPRDLQQLVMILNCLKEGPLTNAMVDIPKFAKKAGLAAGSAKNVLIKLRKKIDDGETNTDAGATSPAAEGTATEGKVKKSSVKKAEKSPAKKAPATRKKKVESNVETEEETNREDEEEGAD